ncbi:hypothetical protein A2886_00850 [candidate division WWE3 bacterium RIFCSPHIGHO2_01_FULL_42_13]|uniref:Uncharacterized protein n=1 Tax=candidate division WWE3 bacterium RIFCSPHIGHO2_01_FULL_42_13 TaxID=1802617 RepID=A0A1F4UQI6_UNCKA|nr:MAG: hypothetical protein A2886_00850 [candidate division WWE3 bacterium RIFCSPHIGHO2_01_FULL_42_13]
MRNNLLNGLAESSLFVRVLFLTLFLAHLFIIPKQMDVLYVTVLIFYILDMLAYKQGHFKALRDSIIAIPAIPVLILLKLNASALVLADYVFLLLLLGLIMQYLKVLWQNKESKI